MDDRRDTKVKVEPQNLPRSRKNYFKICWSWITKRVNSIWFQDLTEWFERNSQSDRESTSAEQMKVPEPYKFVTTLGSGSYGFTIKCEKPHSKDVVLKLAHSNKSKNLMHEAMMCKALMKHKLHNANIVKYHGEIHDRGSLFGLEFEALDMTLQQFLCEYGYMNLASIRIVIRDLAVALAGLKKIGVIHTDLKLDNIMLVDHINQPGRVKVIDFGLAVYSRDIVPGRQIQPIVYRAPEVSLQLAVTEAIDIWALGCMMAKLISGWTLFPTKNITQLLYFFFDLLGPPPERLIKASHTPRHYFMQHGFIWVPMPHLRSGTFNNFKDQRKYSFKSLDDMKRIKRHKNNPMEAIEMNEAVELLKAMLTWDPEDRITPEGILNHPFITGGDEEQSAVESEQAEIQGRDPVKESNDSELPSGVILVKPAAPENRLSMGESADAPAGESPDDPVRDLNGDHDLPSGVAVVKPAAPENRYSVCEGADEPAGSFNALFDADEPAGSSASNNALNDDHDLPSGVTRVKPATPENRYSVCEGADKPAGLSASNDASNDDHDLPSGVTRVKPATPENRSPKGNLTEDPVEHPEDSSPFALCSPPPTRDRVQPEILIMEIKKKNFISRGWSRFKKWVKSRDI